MSESTFTPPPGMTLEHIHAHDDGPADVAIVTLAPGAETDAHVHAELTEKIRLLSGGLCVDGNPHDLSEIGGSANVVISAGARHRLVNWRRDAPAVFLVVVVHQ